MKQGHRRIVKPCGWKSTAKVLIGHVVKYACRKVGTDGDEKRSK